MAKKKTAKKQPNRLSKFFDSGSKKLLVFVLAFAIIGGGFAAYMTFAAPTSTDAQEDPERGSLRRPLTKEETDREIQIANADADKDSSESLGNLRNRIIKKATNEKGTNEKDDKGKINNHYNKAGGCGKGAPWCAAFVSWLYQRSYEPYEIKDAPQTCSVSTLLADKDSKKIRDKRDPKKGDILIAKHGDVSHTAIFARLEGDDFISIDGNWGDEVAVHRENWNDYWDAYIPLASYNIVNRD